MMALRLFAVLRFLLLGATTTAAAAATATSDQHSSLRSVSFGSWPFVGRPSTRLASTVAIETNGRVRIAVGAKGATKAEATTTTSSAAITQPLMEESVWDELEGDEFQQDLELVSALATTGIQVASNDEPDEWIDWRPNQQGNLKDGDICVWTGKSKQGRHACRGSQLPLIKTRSIVPLAADELVELLMDSSKVKTYNPWSIGRDDCWIHNDTTKIVQNRVQPPIGPKLIVSTALLHAQPIPNRKEGSWVIVSRAVKGFPSPKDAGVSEILLGVNLLEPIDESSCQLTCVNHVYSTSIPTMLAERVGVKSAVKFVKDLRRLREEGEI